MNFQFLTFTAVLPEIFILIAICLILLTDAFLGKRFPKLTYSLAQLTLISLVCLTLPLFNQDPKYVLFHGSFVLDNLAVLLKLLIYGFTAITFIYANFSLADLKIAPGEFYTLSLLSVLGMMVIVSAHHFIVLFLGLELFSLPLYSIIALQKDNPACIEAAVKYFVIGSFASGILLYGLSMIYGATKSLDISHVATAVMQISIKHDLILVFGLIFIVVGLAFKLGTVPFHMWVPDVYQGAPTAVVLFLGTASKIATFALVFHLLGEALSGLSAHWQQMLIVVSILSMALGNLTAIVQTNLKRMLAYSSIAHMGYMLLGLITATPQGYGSALFYMITYTLMTAAAFGLVAILNYAGYGDDIEALRGLNSRNPWLALMMLLTLFSLAGVPPIVGFIAKVAVLEALMGAQLTWLAVLALLFAIIGAYYYIRVVKVMYFEAPIHPDAIPCPFQMRCLLTSCGCLLLILGIFPGALFSLCQGVF